MNYQQENLVSQGFVYSCQHPVIDDLLQSFPVSDDSVLNCSKGAQSNSLVGSNADSLVMMQTASYDIQMKTTRPRLKSDLEVKSYCSSEIDTFFVQTPTTNHVTNLSKQIMDDGHVTYCDVQSQPMQLTLDTNRATDCTKSISKKITPKVNEPEPTEKACNYTMLESWFESEQINSLNRHCMYEKPQTHPLQLTQVNSDVKAKESIGKQKKKCKPKKTNICTVCNKTVSGNMTEHMRIHTGERPFTCEECGFSVAKKSNLRSHKRKHTGEKSYMCGICFKMFTQYSHMNSHISHIHKERDGIECSEKDCKKTFSTRTNLKQHVMKQHTGDLKLACEICGEKFGCQSWLNEHLKVHSKRRPFQCDVCKKRFKSKFYVTKHKAKFCCNHGYTKRWQVPGVKKPPGRKRKSKPPDHLPKRSRGRPKGSGSSKRKNSRKKSLIYDSMEELNNSTFTNSDNVCDTNVPLALNTNSANIANETVESNIQKVQYNGVKLEERVFPDCSLENYSPNSNQTQRLSVDNCDQSSILELDLSGETILDFTKQDNPSIRHCFQEPQNLSSNSSNFRHSNVVNGSTSVNDNTFCSSTQGIHTYTKPQNLSIPQNLSMHHQIPHNLETVEPQNLSYQQKLYSQPLWDLSNIQPENLSLPQNLSLAIEPQNLSLQNSLAQPQNLSIDQGLTQPQNLSHSGNISHNINHSHIDHHVHTLPQVHNLSTHIINYSNSNNYSHSQDFTQPQNLTVDQNSINPEHRNCHIQSQPQNLVLPQNLSYGHII